MSFLSYMKVSDPSKPWKITQAICWLLNGGQHIDARCIGYFRCLHCGRKSQQKSKKLKLVPKLKLRAVK